MCKKPHSNLLLEFQNNRRKSFRYVTYNVLSIGEIGPLSTEICQELSQISTNECDLVPIQTYGFPTKKTHEKRLSRYCVIDTPI